MSQASRILRPGHRIDDRYAIVEMLGAGAMGVVYRARQERLQRDVALKVLALPPSPDLVACFEREGIALAKLRHPSIVDVYDAGEHEGLAWLAMELLAGETLGDAIRRSTQLDPAELAEIAPALAEGIAAAHAAGVLHRDLKPDNVFIASASGARKTTKIVDFGVASLAGDRSEEFVGTLYYSPPEILAEKGWTPAADVWSLGVTLFHAAAGARPFQSDSLPELFELIRTGPIPDIRHIASLPSWLADSIMACIVREPTARPTAGELARMLRPRRGSVSVTTERLALQEAQKELRTNIPVVEPLVGRAREVAAVSGAIAGERLVSLIGPGGTGKTRLALEVARQEATSYRGGAWYCDLTASRTPDDIAEVVASAMGLALVQEPEPIQQVGSALASRGGCLLLLDNFEQLAAYASVIEAWLDRAPALRVLVTSRVVLRLNGEHVIEIEPQAQSDAERLFAERAVRAGVQLRAEDAVSISSIVKSVDNIPLAIELAAARLQAMSIKQLADRLDEPLRMLSAQRRGTSSRQSTLRAVVDASWNALTAEEQQVLARCSVFVGGWSLEAAEAIAGDGGADVLDLLQSLKDQSMVRIGRDDEGEVRFSMLAVLREYAAERLSFVGEADAIRARHAKHMIGWAERTTGFDPDFASRARLRSEIPNVLAAVDFSEPNAALRGILALEPVLGGHNPFLLIERVGRVLGGASDELVRLRAKLAVARASAGANPKETAELEAIAAEASRLGLPGLAAQALIALNDGDLARSDLAKLGARIEEAMRIAPAMRPILVTQIASWHLRAGRLDEALAAIEEALAGLGGAADLQLRAYRAAAVIAINLRDHERADRHSTEAIGLAERLGDRRMLVSLLNNHALTKIDLGQLAQAKDLLHRGLRTARETGQKGGEAYITGNLGMVSAVEGDLPAARGYLGATVRLASELAAFPGRAIMNAWLGWISAAEGRVDVASELIGQALASVRDIGDARSARTVELLGRQLDLIRARSCEPEEARRIVEDVERDVAEGRRSDSFLTRLAARRVALSLRPFG
ncbi:MAG: protein kinase [Polyangiaceae bacterium]|nr:protein kinase [Polyangiaceae bacterium]